MLQESPCIYCKEETSDHDISCRGACRRPAHYSCALSAYEDHTFVNCSRDNFFCISCSIFNIDEKTVPFLSQNIGDSSKNSNQKSTRIDTLLKESPSKKTQIDTSNPSKSTKIDTFPEKSPSKKTQIDILSPSLVQNFNVSPKSNIFTYSPTAKISSNMEKLSAQTFPEKSPSKKTQIDTPGPSNQKPIIIDTFPEKSPSEKTFSPSLIKNLIPKTNIFTYSPPAKISPNLEKSSAQTQHDMKESHKKMIEEMSGELKYCTTLLRELSEDKKKLPEFLADFTSWNEVLRNLRYEIMKEFAIVRTSQFETQQNVIQLQNQLQKISDNLLVLRNEFLHGKVEFV